MWQFSILGAVLAVAGAVMLHMVFQRIWLVWRLRRGVRTMGSVVEHVAETRMLTVEFHDNLGNRRVFHPDSDSIWEQVYGSLPVGSQVEVVHLPKKPDQCRLFVDTANPHTSTSLNAGTLLVLVFNKLMAVLGGASMVRREGRLRRKLRKRGVHTTGTVIGNGPSGSSSEFRPTYYPKIQFEDEQGESHTFVHSLVSRGADGEQVELPAIGEVVEVTYLPDTPRVAMWSAAGSAFGGFALIFVIGVLFLVFGLFTFLSLVTGGS